MHDTIPYGMTRETHELFQHYELMWNIYYGVFLVLFLTFGYWVIRFDYRSWWKRFVGQVTDDVTERLEQRTQEQGDKHERK